MVVCLFGDSITEGIGKRKDNYCNFLFEKLSSSFPDVTINNFAHTGTTIKFLDNFDFDILDCDVCIISYGNVDGMLRPNTLHRPNFYKYLPKRYKQNGMLNPRPYFSHKRIKSFFQHCDSSFRWRLNRFLLKVQGSMTWVSLDEFKSRYEKLIKTFIRKGTKVILTTTVRVSDKYFPGTNQSYEQFNDIIRTLSKDNNVPIVDLFYTLCSNDFMDDFFHPNLNGYKKIADLLAREIINNENIRNE